MTTISCGRVRRNVSDMFMSKCKGYIPHTITLGYPITDLDRPLGLQEVEASRICRQSAYEGGKVVSHMPSYTTTKRRRVG